MAQGPRSECPGSKRRKQANPRRKNVLIWGSAVEAALDSDKDDWLLLKETDHVHPGGGGAETGGEVWSGLPPLLIHGQQEQEEEILQESLSWTFDERSEEFDGASLHSAGNPTVTQVDGRSHMKQYLLKQPLEEDEGHQATFATYRQHNDTAIIYPEAPEELMPFSTPDTIGPEKKMAAGGVLDASPQTVVCPFCQRGYKQLLSLNDQILDHHQKNQGRFCCHHMTRHQPTVTRHQPPTHPLSDSGNRKFQCCECQKAFKYKHHLKEHLRIHSGEKPYECSSCKKRFSHSGSYSSHISSKKCVSVTSLNGRLQNHNGRKPSSLPNSSSSSPGSPALNQLHSAPKDGQIFGLPEAQRSLDIESEPMDLGEYQLPKSMQRGFSGSGISMTGPAQDSPGICPLSLVQQLVGVGVDLSLLGYTTPLKNNLSAARKVFQTVDDTGCRQEMDQNPETFKLSASTPQRKNMYPNSPTRRFIDYTMEKVTEATGLIGESKRQVGIWKEKLNQDQNHFLLFSCQYCQETFSGPIPLHQHERYLCNMNEEIRAVLQPESPPAEQPSSDGSTSPGLFKDHVSVLKPYSAMKTEPNSEELLKISIAVGLSQEIVTEWFDQWKSQNLLGLKKWSTTADCGGPGNCSSSSSASAHRPVDSLDRFPPQSNTWSLLNLSYVSSKNSQSSSYTPNCRTSEEFISDGPLDLSLSKHLVEMLDTNEATPPRPNDLLDVSDPQSNSGPSDYISIRTEVLGLDGRRNSTHLQAETSSPLFGINTFAGCPAYTSHGAFPPPTFMTPAPLTVHVRRPYAGLDSISFLPHLPYTYTGASSLTDVQLRRKFQQRPAFQGALQPNGLELKDSESLLGRKKEKKTDSGMYACDLCDKTFRKTSSLLRHKYEHTGQRPHQCAVCHKAFKHKHHLVEHSRLHSGEKPYQCDKCGKRFSHSGSYSQHMNHRYAYCKREAEEREAQREAHHPAAGGGLEPTELLRRRTHLQLVDPIGPSRTEDQQEAGTSWRGGGGEEAADTLESCSMEEEVQQVEEVQEEQQVEQQVEEVQDGQQREEGQEEQQVEQQVEHAVWVEK